MVFNSYLFKEAMAVPMAPCRAHGLDAWKIHEFLSWWVSCAMEVCGVMPHSFIARCSRKHHIVAVMVRHPLSRLMCKGQVRSQTKNGQSVGGSWLGHQDIQARMCG